MWDCKNNLNQGSVLDITNFFLQFTYIENSTQYLASIQIMNMAEIFNDALDMDILLKSLGL